MTVLLCCLWGVAEAHVPNIASYTLVEDGAAWRLEVSLPTSGMHQALERVFPGVALHDLTVEDYEGRLEAVLREGMGFTFDGAPAAIGPAVVALGSHETAVRFAVTTDVTEPEAVAAHIDALHERGDQNNVFRVVSRTVQDHVVLKDANGFRGELALVPEAVVEEPEPARSVMPWALALLGVVGIGSGWAGRVLWGSQSPG